MKQMSSKNFLSRLFVFLTATFGSRGRPLLVAEASFLVASPGKRRILPIFYAGNVDKKQLLWKLHVPVDCRAANSATTIVIRQSTSSRKYDSPDYNYDNNDDEFHLDEYESYEDKISDDEQFWDLENTARRNDKDEILAGDDGTITNTNNDNIENSSTTSTREEQLLDFSIDSFLRGEYNRPLSDDAPAPHPGLTPQKTIEEALHSLRQLDDPEPSHGAAVLMRFCVPLSRGERWGDSSSSSSRVGQNKKKRQQQQQQGSAMAWKEVLRGAITPTMLARRLRASEFSCLLDWSQLDVTEGAYSVQRDDGIEIGVPSSMAFVNAALYFEEGVEPVLIQFTLRKINGVWLIDSARLSPKGLFVDSENVGK